MNAPAPSQQRKNRRRTSSALESGEDRQTNSLVRLVHDRLVRKTTTVRVAGQEGLPVKLFRHRCLDPVVAGEFENREWWANVRVQIGGRFQRLHEPLSRLQTCG